MNNWEKTLTPKLQSAMEDFERRTRARAIEQ
jgi:hypothetical protein